MVEIQHLMAQMPSRPAEPQDALLPNKLADLTNRYPRLLRKRDRALEVLESKTHWLELM